MSFATMRNLGAMIKVLRAAANTAATAAGTGDNTAVTGVTIDRAACKMPLSAVVAIAFSATLAATKKLFLKSVVVEHGDASDLSDAATYLTLEDTTGTAVATGATGGSTETGCKEYDIDLSGAKRYIRIKFTPDLDATATDTAALAAVLVVGGGSEVPV